MQPKAKNNTENIVSKYTDQSMKGSAIAIHDLVKKTEWFRIERDIIKRCEKKFKKYSILKMASEILRFTEKPVIDESVQEYQFHEYEPQARTNLNSAGEIVEGLRERTEYIDKILFSAHHSMAFYILCFIYW